MNWDKPLDGNAAANIFFAGIEDLYDTVSSSPIGNYPQGMTVRILMGRTQQSNKDDVLKILVEDLGIPLEATNWKLEVADYPKNYPRHSHVKTMIVDGKTVIVAGYNMQRRYFPSSPQENAVIDRGLKLSGDIAQEALKMFDNLWLGSKVCTVYSVETHACGNSAVVATITHAPNVMAPQIPGGETNTFSLYRDENNHEAEEAIYNAMSTTNNEIKMLQDRVLYAPRVQAARRWFGWKIAHYQNGIFDALENGRTVRYIFNCEFAVCPVNIRAYHILRNTASNLNMPGTIQAKTAKGVTLLSSIISPSNFLHAKTVSIDGEMLIVGSMNLDGSSWGSYGSHVEALPNLAEYDIAIDSATATAEHDNYFDAAWNSNDYTEPKFADPGAILQNLIDQAISRDIIFLPEGVYQESLVIDKPLMIIGSGQESIIEPPSGQPAFEVTSSDVTIYHLTIRGSTDFGIKLVDSSPNSLENVLIRKVLFEDNALGGILIEGLISGSPISYTLENNTFIGGDQGVKINLAEQQNTNSTLRNNLFFGQSIVPIKISSATDGGVEYSYNLFNNCARAVGGVCPTNWYEGNLSSTSSEHDNLLNQDPAFSNPAVGAYTLLPGSPAIDAGDPATINGMCQAC